MIKPIAGDDALSIAGKLISRFGSLPEVLGAKPYAWREVLADQPAVRRHLKLLRSAELHLRRVEVGQRPMLGNWQALLDYARARQAHADVEELRALFLNGRNSLIRDERLWMGTVDQCPLYVREVMKRALELSAAAIIVIHNHPAGDPKPSRADIETTRLLVQIGRNLGVTVHDHLIVARAGHCSMKSMGLL